MRYLSHQTHKRILSGMVLIAGIAIGIYQLVLITKMRSMVDKHERELTDQKALLKLVLKIED